MKSAISGILLISPLLLTGCSFGTDETDQLRTPPAPQGISVGLQVNLPADSLTTDAVASIYEDGKRKPLVGGDFFLVAAAGADAMLISEENLSGIYSGQIDVANEYASVTLSTVHDPLRARQDRWYPVDELLIDPGPDEDLVGYSETITFPARLENLTTDASIYTNYNNNIILSWDADNGDQMNSLAVVTCHGNNHQSHTFPKYNVLGDVDMDGSYTLQVNDIIPEFAYIETVASFYLDIITVITAHILNIASFGLIDIDNEPGIRFEITSCDVALTVFREIAFPLPENVAGGYAISSTSNTVRFRFEP